MKTQKSMATLAGAALIALIAAAPTRADTLIFYPTDDAFLEEYSPGVNFGSWDMMVARNTGSGPWEEDPLVRFDISSVPPGTEIASATLHLYYYRWDDHYPGGRPLICRRITSDWDEETVTWNTRPGWASEITDQTNVPDSYQWMEWGVTDDVQAFVNGEENDYGWVIRDETYWSGSDIPRTFFRTKEYGAYVPYLEVIPTPGTLALLAIGGLATHRRRR